MGRGREMRTIAYRLLALLLVFALCSADLTALAYAADGSGSAAQISGEESAPAVACIGTEISADGKLLLIPQTGFSFYQGNNLVTGRQAWTKAVTFTVRPDHGYTITDISVEENGDPSDDVTITAPTGTGRDWTLAFSAPGDGEADQKIVVTAELKDEMTTIYLDLALGDITIGNSTYTGSYMEINGGTPTQVNKSGATYDAATTRFHIYQSTAATRNKSGVIDGIFVAPVYADVTVNGKPWREYITNNTDALAVYQAWHGTDDQRTGSLFADREPTDHGITISVTGRDCDVTLENIWSTKQPSSQSDNAAGIYVSGCDTANTRVTLRLKGDSKLGRLNYYCKSENGSSITITDIEGTGMTGNSLTVVGDPRQLNSDPGPYKGQVAKNNWQAIIGANDSVDQCYGIVINGSTLYAGSASDWENCTAIGGGGNGMGQVTINGGHVTAVARTTGTAIGGGIAHTGTGGPGEVTINAGNIYAYNYGVRAYLTVDDFGTTDPDTLWQASHIPGTAIGGASSIKQPGNSGTVTINGGYVYAESLGGAALGGGNSVTKGAGAGTIVINGGTVEAKSVGQKDYTNGAVSGYDVEPGVAIGGGTAGLGAGITANGGYADVTINGGTIRTGSIGGGGTNDKDTTNPGKIGYADVTINGGDISGQIIMAGDVDPCKFTMTGGTLRDSDVEDANFPRLQKNGGAVYMDDRKGEATVSGGTIKDCQAENGGAVYMTAGIFTLTGGTIQNCSAAGSGGGIYMGGGTLSISGGSLTGNKAVTGNGGAAYIENGSVVMSGGSVDNNTAQNGGGMYVSVMEENANVGIKIFSGSVSNNTASGNGGALAVVGNPLVTAQLITIVLGVEELHWDADGNKIGSFTHEDSGITYTHTDCPVISGNSVGSGGTGGAIYLNGGSDATKTQLNIYCLDAKDNQDGTRERRSDFMMVAGGKLLISSAVDEKVDVNVNPDNKQGDASIQGSMHITGGQVDLYGSMQNPGFLAELGDRFPITVDVTDSANEWFRDHRYVEADIRTVTYFENFQGSGRYSLYHTTVGEYTIESSMYYHEGYELLCWYTAPSTAEPGVEYQANTTCTFNGTDSPAGVDAQGNLTVYGIWEATGFWVQFHSNGPVNVPVDGEMNELQSFTYHTPQKLLKNAFSCQGYMFLGWHTDPYATQPLYADEEVVSNLTLENNGTIHLYGVWEKCTHEEVHKYQYAVVDNGSHRKILQRSCSCGMVWERVLSAEDATYDGDPHGAELSTVSGWTDELTITYAQGGTVLGEPPVNAGEDYRASVALQAGLIAEVVYAIQKAPQDMPPKPEFVASVEGEVTYLQVERVPSGKTPTKYRLIFYTDGAEMSTGWEDEAAEGEFACKLRLPQTFTYYWVEVYYEEGANYRASEISRSTSVYIYEGATIHVDWEEGLDRPVMSQPQEGLQFELSLQTGYHLKNGEYEIKIEVAPNLPEKYPTMTKSSTHSYTMTDVAEGSEVWVTFGGAKKSAKLKGTVTGGQVFGTMQTDAATTTVSRDSAFTAAFSLGDFDGTDYNDLALSFEPALPEAATIIFVDKTEGANTYWHFTATGSVTEITLDAFSRMGASEEGYQFSGEALSAQLIVDLSRVAAKDLLAVDTSLSMAFGAVEKGNAPALWATVVVELQQTTFALQAEQGAEPMSYMVSYTVTCPQSASKWETREMALVLTPKSGTLPADAWIQKVSGTTSTKYIRNGNGNFVIPLGAVTGGTVTLQMYSELLPRAEAEYTFDAAWMAADSLADAAPMNGELLQTAVVRFQKSQEARCSLKITGEEVVSDGALQVAMQYQDIPGACAVLLVVEQKSDDGRYIAIGQRVTFAIEPDESVRQLEIPLTTSGSGSYRLVCTLTHDNTNVLSVPYYFLISVSEEADVQ